jgi:precorrin-6A/cobalt-precorrin-6A reductase
MTHVLILGGTAEARDLAARLEAKGVPLTSSLAGRVSRPRLPVGPVRVGGFGGVEGLERWLAEHEVSAVVDATHPFATTMGAHAAQACSSLGLPLLRLARPGWGDHPDAGSWTWVDAHPAAREAADEVGGVPFVTTGRQTLHHHVEAWRERPAVVRLVEPPDEPLPTAWTVLRSRGPYDPAGEESLMREHGVTVLMTKDSGGSYTEAKLDAARSLGVPVVVVARPARAEGVEQVSTPEAAADWVGPEARRGARGRRPRAR